MLPLCLASVGENHVASATYILYILQTAAAALFAQLTRQPAAFT